MGAGHWSCWDKYSNCVEQQCSVGSNPILSVTPKIRLKPDERKPWNACAPRLRSDLKKPRPGVISAPRMMAEPHFHPFAGALMPEKLSEA